MDVVIQHDRSGAHNISKYQFKILSSLAGASIAEAREELGVHEGVVERRKESSATPKDELIESLMKKADEMSSNVIKMQMRIEAMQEDHAQALEEARKAGYEEGIAAGIAQEQAQRAGQNAQSHDQLAQSVKTLEYAATEFVTALVSIQKELTHTALEIAKEVIGIETHDNSSKIAAKLSGDLIEELKDASKITLRVNPIDHGFISEKVGSLSHVEVLSDRAISPGGVVAISDAGNIDSEIKKRYERLKRSLLLES
ncbi:MAG: flagellar assembly protein FliH [Sulfuricurvum sp.]|uniref:flagellar assembly protein FliH n=1 Tax=Sulfuricurvum sp. TaxID=2025608 RepID=UPI00261797C4|nr:flagellar assembly protein FliH [Sulfuricurvum sp.]MDD2949879.1 flagellar assembly protein FliH [Sulfuricurvum sp.]MDD5117281.1 flagellar assembly protein FliH [Sulfuricurvum sp.]